MGFMCEISLCITQLSYRLLLSEYHIQTALRTNLMCLKTTEEDQAVVVFSTKRLCIRAPVHVYV